MTSFDFSLYDNSDESIPVVKSKSKAQQKPKQTDHFDFDQYDFTEYQTPEVLSVEESAKNDPIYQQYAPKELTKEQLKNMSVQERLQYAQEQKTAREYLQSAGFTKNALSSLSFGATENIDALKPQPHELNQEFGKLVGAAAPIGVSAKAIGIPVKAAFQNAPKVLKPLEKFLHAFGTGATYEGGVQGVDALSGNDVDLKQIPIRGAEFATIDAFLRGGSALAKKFLNFSPAHQAQILEQGIIPQDLPKSQYETAEEMLKLVQREAPSKQTFPGFPGGEPPSPPNGSAPAKIKPERITPAKDIGLRPVTEKANPALQDQVGDIFSKQKFYNTTEGGKAFKNEIMNIDEDVYRGVNELYKTSRELNSAIEEIHPQLVSKLESRISELKKIPEPSDVQKRLIKAQDKILKNLVEYENITDEAGNVIDKHITGYKPINNQTIIDQVQSLRQIIDYDFAHGNTKNIFKPLINDLQDSALRAAETSGNQEAASAINEARSAYRIWAEAFDNDYVRPFRDSSNQDFSKLFKSALDLDESNMLKKILGITENGKQLSDASTREIVEKHLSKYFENPRSYTQRDFNTTLRELEAVISPEQAKQIKDSFAEASKRPDIRATKQPQRKPTNDELIASRYEKSQPEDIQRMMDSRSGIKQLRKDFSDTKVKKEVFQRLSNQKMRSILREGNIEKDFTGDDLYKFLNKEKNYELFSEFLGEKETELLRQSAKDIGKTQVKSEMRKKNISKAAHKVAAFKTLEILINLF